MVQIPDQIMSVQSGMAHIWDHNKERVYERACEIVDETTRDMVAGVAYHWYIPQEFLLFLRRILAGIPCLDGQRLILRTAGWTGTLCWTNRAAPITWGISVTRR